MFFPNFSPSLHYFEGYIDHKTIKQYGEAEKHDINASEMDFTSGATFREEWLISVCGGPLQFLQRQVTVASRE